MTVADRRLTGEERERLRRMIDDRRRAQLGESVADRWLVDALAGGPVSAQLLTKQAQRAGHGSAALAAARRRLGVVTRRTRSGGFAWSLPEDGGE